MPIKPVVFGCPCNTEIQIKKRLLILVHLNLLLGTVVKLLACGARGLEFEPRARHLNFKYLVSPASQCRYDRMVVKAT